MATPIGRSRKLLRTLHVSVALGTAALLMTTTANVAMASPAVNAAGLSRAQKAVQVGEQPNTGFQAPGPAFGTSSLAGKKIWVITFLSVPFAQQNVQGIQEAAAAVGAKVSTVDGTAGVAAYQQGISEATAQGASAVVVGTLNPSLFTPQLTQARAKGIKVVAVSSQKPGTLPPASQPVNGYVDPCYTCAGALMADSVIADSKGKAHAVVLWSSDVQIPGETQLGAIKSEFKKNCPSCVLKVVDVPSTEWATRLQSATQTVLTSDPSVNYLLPLYDGMVSYMQPAIRAAGALKRVKIATFNATPAVMQQIGGGGDVLADVGIGSIRYGWAWADQTFRALAGVAPVKSEQLPVRLFDASNIGQLNLAASTDTWYGTVNYRAAYLKLWGAKT
jgi:ribose transport system substrate-binding protein